MLATILISLVILIVIRSTTPQKNENYPSVKKVSEPIDITLIFINFTRFDKADVKKSSGNLNSFEVGTFKNIPTKCVRGCFY